MELTDGTLSLTASDSETTLSTSLEVNESDGDGRFAVSSKTILEALKEIPEQPLTFLVNTERRKCGTRNNGRSGDAGRYQPFFVRYCR